MLWETWFDRCVALQVLAAEQGNKWGCSSFTKEIFTLIEVALQPQTLFSFPSQGHPSRYEKAHEDPAYNVINKNLYEKRDHCLSEG